MTKKRRGRPPGVDSADTRERALVAAFDLISEQGYRATSMAQVAAAAGLSQSGLHHHFVDKKELLAAVLERRDQIDELVVHLDHVSGPWEALAQVEELVRINVTRPQIVRLFVKVTAEAVDEGHPAHCWMRAHYARIQRQLATAFEAGRRDGSLRADASADRLAREVIAEMDGLQLQWLLDPEFDMAAALTEYMQGLRRLWQVPS